MSEEKEKKSNSKSKKKEKKLTKNILKTIKKYAKTKISIGILVALAVVLAFVIPGLSVKHYDPVIEVSSTIEKIVNVNELSTFQVVYNGVATIMDEDDPEEVAYYVSYKATTKAGFNVKDLYYDTNENNEFIIKIPEITIQDPIVDISSLDYIFYDSDKNELGVSSKAYQACCNDVRIESEKEEAIYDLARQNAEKLIRALAEPFIENMEGNYTLKIE